MLSNVEPERELPLLRTKLAIPPPRVRPPSSVDGADQPGGKGPLTLICAPAGFGETNLLAEWAAQATHAAQSSLSQSALSIAWQKLSREDNGKAINQRFANQAK